MAGCFRKHPAAKSGPNQEESRPILSAGDFHTCGLKIDGSAVCWGAGADREDCNPGANGAVSCWGSGEPGTGINSYGQNIPPDDFP